MNKNDKELTYQLIKSGTPEDLKRAYNLMIELGQDCAEAIEKIIYYWVVIKDKENIEFCNIEFVVKNHFDYWHIYVFCGLELILEGKSEYIRDFIEENEKLLIHTIH